MFSRVAKQFVILCVTFGLLFILCAAASAAAAEAATAWEERVDKLIQDWERHYGKSGYWKIAYPDKAKEMDAANALAEHSLSRNDSISQTETLRYTVEAFLQSYGLSSSERAFFWPVFQSWLELGRDQLHLYSINGQQ